MFLWKAFNTQRLLMATRVSRVHYLQGVAKSGVLLNHFGYFLSDRHPKWNFRPAAEINEDFQAKNKKDLFFEAKIQTSSTTFRRVTVTSPIFDLQPRFQNAKLVNFQCVKKVCENSSKNIFLKIIQQILDTNKNDRYQTQSQTLCFECRTSVG